MIPIIIICYNNYKYVENTIKQIREINPLYVDFITIMDNDSNCNNTIKYLKNCNIPIIWNKYNNGPWILSINYQKERNNGLFNILPEKFILTDPDLEFNKNLPSNFIEILIKLSEKYKCSKIGFALDISDYDKMFSDSYVVSSTIKEWESQFWNMKIEDDYELYNADVDTTFCLINKKYSNNKLKIRIAGNFTAKHLPWYKKNNIYNEYETYMTSLIPTKISTTNRLAYNHFSNNFFKISIYNENFLFDKENYTLDLLNLNFKNQMFCLDTLYYSYQKNLLNKSKVVIDIGAGNGEKTIFLSRKAKHVYTIEHDSKYFKTLSRNCEINCDKNYTLINKFFYFEDDINIDVDNDSNIITSISIENIIKNYNINVNELSLICIDIRGQEEELMYYIIDIKISTNIKIYVKLYYDLWKNKDLDRFSIFTLEQKKNIMSGINTILI